MFKDSTELRDESCHDNGGDGHWYSATSVAVVRVTNAVLWRSTKFPYESQADPNTTDGTASVHHLWKHNMCTSIAHWDTSEHQSDETSLLVFFIIKNIHQFHVLQRTKKRTGFARYKHLPPSSWPSYLTSTHLPFLTPYCSHAASNSSLLKVSRTPSFPLSVL